MFVHYTHSVILSVSLIELRRYLMKKGRSVITICQTTDTLDFAPLFSEKNHFNSQELQKGAALPHTYSMKFPLRTFYW